MTDVQQLYTDALSSLIEKVKTDNYIVAAVLVGSLAYDKVWKKSDIDLILVTDEAKLSRGSHCLVESDIIIHCAMKTRSEFRKILEGVTQGSFMHSLMGKGTMLFSRDETLVELFDNRHAMGQRDRSIQLLRTTHWMLPALTKAEKWFYARQDYDYCFHWIMKCIDQLASVELLLHGEVPSREVIQRAVILNPTLFNQIYKDLIHTDPTEAKLEAALIAINNYLKSNAELLFEPLLAYLREEGELRSASDIDHHFSRNFAIEGIAMACEWLSDEAIIERMALPVRLTTKSKVNVEEVAFYLGRDNNDSAIDN